MCETHSEINYFLSLHTLLVLKKIEINYVHFLTLITIEVTSPEPNWTVFSLNITPKILCTYFLDWTRWFWQRYLENTTLLLSAIIWYSIHLPMHPCPKSIQLAIVSQKQIVVTAWYDLLYRKSICKNFNWFLSMHVHAITYSKLPILIKTHSKYFTSLCKKQTVKFSTTYLFYALSTKILLVWTLRLYFYCPTVFVKNFLVLSILILKFSKLESIIFANTVHFSLLTKKNAVLEAATELYDVNTWKWFN